MVPLQEHDDAEVEEIYDDYRWANTTLWIVCSRWSPSPRDVTPSVVCLTHWASVSPPSQPKVSLEHGALRRVRLPAKSREHSVRPLTSVVGCRPARVMEGKPHPDPIVETACLANVLPPVPTYRHHIGPCVAAGMLSDAQIETVIYANQRFELPPLADGAHRILP